jgi:hypothetical protein
MSRFGKPLKNAFAGPECGAFRISKEKPLVENPHRYFKFQKRSQLFIRTHNETFPIATMRVSNPDRSPFGIDGCDPADTPTSFLEIVDDCFPVSSMPATV